MSDETTNEQPPHADSPTGTPTDSPNQASEQLNWWARIRQKRWARWTFDLGIFALMFAGISMWQGRDFVSSGEPAPAIALEGLDGEFHQLEDYRGKKTMVVFWAPWCGVCGAESDNVSRVKSWVGDRVNVVSVALSYEGRPSIQSFVAEHNVDYPVLLGNRQVGVDYNISAYPTMYVIDAEGRVEHTVAGYATTFGMLWRVLI